MSAVKWTSFSVVPNCFETDKQHEFEAALLQGDMRKAEQICKSSSLDIKEAWFKIVNANFINSVDKILALEFLLGHGADINAQDENLQTALHLAVLHKEPDVVNWLATLSKNSSRLFQKNPSLTPPIYRLQNASGNTWFHEAIINNISLHLNYIFCITDPNLRQKATPEELSIAQKTFLQFLEIPNLEGETALILSCKYKNYEMARWLSSNGATPNTQDRSGHSAFYYAFLNGVPNPLEGLTESHILFNSISLGMLQQIPSDDLERVKEAIHTIVTHKNINDQAHIINSNEHMKFICQHYQHLLKGDQSVLDIASQRGDTELAEHLKK